MSTLIKIIGGTVIITGILIATAPDEHKLRTQISSDLYPIMGYVIPIQTRDFGIAKLSALHDNLLYLGVLGR